MARGISTKAYTPVRVTAQGVMAWCATGARERGLPVYALKRPQAGDKVLRFPMGGNAKGCVQVMETPA